MVRFELCCRACHRRSSSWCLCHIFCLSSTYIIYVASPRQSLQFCYFNSFMEFSELIFGCCKCWDERALEISGERLKSVLVGGLFTRFQYLSGLDIITLVNSPVQSSAGVRADWKIIPYWGLPGGRCECECMLGVGVSYSYKYKCRIVLTSHNAVT